MTLKTFDTLEGAVVTLNKYISLASYKPSAPKNDRAIYPARYDHAPINNIAKQVTKGIGMTDKQQALAILLVTKYNKQFKKHGYDVSNISIDTPTEFEIRTDVDRRKSAYFTDNKIHLRFPYIPRLIGQVAEFARQSCGSIAYVNAAKHWDISPTAGNLAWLDKFISDHNFIREDSYIRLLEELEQAYDYKSIQLDIVDDELVLHDAPPTMSAWIEANLGSIEMANFVPIASSANMLAFTLTDSVVRYTFDNYPHLAEIILQKRSFINSDNTTFEELLHKVKRLHYNTIAVFVADHTELPDICKTIWSVMPDYNIMTENGFSGPTVDTGKNISVSNKVLATDADLIISMAGFMAGPSRRNWFNTAVKNIYYCQDIDNKIKKIIRKDESNFNYKRRN